MKNLFDRVFDILSALCFVLLIGPDAGDDLPIDSWLRPDGRDNPGSTEARK
jgi:hypothetical protein